MAKTAANARRFLRDLERACPLHIRYRWVYQNKALALCLWIANMLLLQ